MAHTTLAAAIAAIDSLETPEDARVRFTSRRDGARITGTVLRAHRRSVSVQADGGGQWLVGASLLEAVS